jgi:hypothetical protein
MSGRKNFAALCGTACFWDPQVEAEEHPVENVNWKSRNAGRKSLRLGALADNEKYKPATPIREQYLLDGARRSKT